MDIEALEDAEDARLVDAARAEGGLTIPIEEIKRELGLGLGLHERSTSN